MMAATAYRGTAAIGSRGRLSPLVAPCGADLLAPLQAGASWLRPATASPLALGDLQVVLFV